MKERNESIQITKSPKIPLIWGSYQSNAKEQLKDFARIVRNFLIFQNEQNNKIRQI